MYVCHNLYLNYVRPPPYLCRMQAALLNAVILGAVKIVSPFVAVLTVEHLGRRCGFIYGPTNRLLPNCQGAD